MKTPSKVLVYLLAPLAASLLFVGCETDAAEDAAKDAGSASADAPAQESADKPADSTAAPQSGSATNETATAAGSTNTVTVSTNLTNLQNVTVIQELPPTIPSHLKFSKAALEVIKMAQAGVSEAVLIAFIDKSEDSFEIGAEEILYLNDIGVAQTVIAAMMNKGEAGSTSTDVQVAQTPAEPAPATNTTPAPSLLSGNYTGAPTAQVEVTTNYVADPNAVPQQQVVVEQQPVVVQQPVVIEQPAVTYSYFYSSLQPYGSWVYLNSYGWCWQPTIAVSHSHWRPYSHGGRWLWTDAGWYWHSEYSWGWAPFHYGRWFCPPGRGWVWVPDYTWGPSWVTWRRSHDYFGWAPLPPRAYCRPGIGFSYYDVNVGFGFSFGFTHDHYTFVPRHRFHGHRVADHIVPTHNTVNIYKDSVVVNNYIRGDNNTIVNEGISRDYVARVNRTEIQKVNIQDAPAQSGTRIPSERLVRDGSRSTVYRPKPPPADMVKAVEARQYRQEAPKTAAVAGGGSGTLIRGTPVPAASRGTRLSPRAEAETAASSTPGRRPSTPVTRNPDFSSRTSQETGARTQAESVARQSAVDNTPRVVGSRTSSRSEATLPAVPKPSPLVRPESPPAVTRSQEALASRGSTAVGSGLISTSPTGRPAPVARPASPPVASSGSTRQSAGSVTAAPGSVSSSRAVNPPIAASQPRPVVTPRTEAGRLQSSPTVTRQVAPSSPTPITRSPVPGYTPSTRAANNSSVRSAPSATPAPAPSTGRGRLDTWSRPSASPAPAPVRPQPAPASPAPSTGRGRLDTWSRPAATAPAPSTPRAVPAPSQQTEIRQSFPPGTTTRPAINVQPSTPRATAPYQAPRPAAPATPAPSTGRGRLETWARPAATPAPAPAVQSRPSYTPRSVTPVPAPRPSYTPAPAPARPSYSPPPSSAPASRGRLDTWSRPSAPAHAPSVGRPAPSAPPSAPAPSQGRGRGRVEINR